MALNLSNIDQAPRALPVWDVIITDLGNPHPRRIAKALGVGTSTVYRWQALGGGPRIACLALFWLTRWGRSQVHTQAANDAALYSQLATSLAEERERLAGQVQLLTRALTPTALGLPPAAPTWQNLTWPPVQHGASEGVGLPSVLGESVSPVRQTGRVTSTSRPGDQVEADRLGQPLTRPAKARKPHQTADQATAAAPAPCARPRPPEAAAAAPGTAGTPNAAPCPTGRPGHRGQQKARHGAQRPAVDAQQLDPRQASPTGPHRSAGDQKAGRSPPARAPEGGSPLRGLDGPSHGDAPHTPPPRAERAENSE